MPGIYSWRISKRTSFEYKNTKIKSESITTYSSLTKSLLKPLKDNENYVELLEDKRVYAEKMHEKKEKEEAEKKRKREEDPESLMDWFLVGSVEELTQNIAKVTNQRDKNRIRYR